MRSPEEIVVVARRETLIAARLAAAVVAVAVAAAVRGRGRSWPWRRPFVGVALGRGRPVQMVTRRAGIVE